MADIVEWLDSDSVGIEDIDKDHQRLVLLANALVKSAFEGEKDKFLVQGLSELLMFTEEHFTREEKYLEQMAVPTLLEHKLQHKEIVDRLFELNEQLREGTLDAVNVATFLMDWLYSHMRGADHEVFRSIKNRSDEPETTD